MALALNLIGAGNVGRVLARLFNASGQLQVQDVLTRSLAGAQQAVGFIGAGRACAALADMAPAAVWLLAVGDDQIEPACAALAERHDLADALVFHCSGARASDALHAASARGAACASVHPIRSFADAHQVAGHFGGTFCGIEGDARACTVLTAAFEAIGAQLVPIDAGAKTVYHAASVFASNYLVTLLDAALRAYQAAGIPEPTARQLCMPLASETLANVFRLGPERALTGPIARGDLLTVARQQAALDSWQAASGALYAALAQATLALAQRDADNARG